MKKLFVIAILASTFAFAQRPTAYTYHSFYASTTSNQIYADSQVEGTMSGSFPPGAIKHTYTASFSIQPPAGFGLSSVPCSMSQTGNPDSGFDVVCSGNISSIGVGIYYLNLSDSAYCSYAGTFFSDGGSSMSALGFTPIQHNYPNNPLPKTCRITSFFDAVRTSGAHHALDLVFDNGQGGGTIPPYGTPVTAMEAGTVIAAVSGQPSAPYPACMSGNPRPPGDYVKIVSDSDHYSTVYFHMTPSVSNGQHVNAGQVIGTLDASGCQSHAHLHVARKDPAGNLVNFTIPCVNQVPVTQYDDGEINDSVPENW